jgi:hypothetical protein
MKIIIIAFVILFFLFFIFLYKRAYSFSKVRSLSEAKKHRLLNKLLSPYGFSYSPESDIFTSNTDAWQRDLGYETFYDLTSLSMNMVLDCEPIYFNYQNKTWLFEFWKGQYGINTGAEAGIYHADSIVPPMLRPQTVFQAADQEEMLPLELHLTGPEGTIFHLHKSHWWLSGFIKGVTTLPEDLMLKIGITFPNEEMSGAFMRALENLGYKKEEIQVDDQTVSFYFTHPRNIPDIPYDVWVQSYVFWKSGLFCRLYLWITGPFNATADRLLYLYYFMPAFFGRAVRIRMYGHRRKPL